MSKLVSILIISRNRFDSLLEATDSIVKNTKDLKRVEIVLRFDEDDDNSLSRLKELPQDKIDINIIIGKRWGYEKLYEYVNEICKKAKGEFLAWFNDDCVIESKNWDDIIAEYTNKIVCLDPNHKGTGSGNIFPIISKKVFEILGHWALSQQVDTWQMVVGNKSGISIKRNDLVFIHNRKQDYVSDENRSEVLQRTAKVWRNSNGQIKRDIKKIQNYLKNQKK